MAVEWDLLDLAIATANRLRDWVKWYIMLMIPGVRPPSVTRAAPSWFTHTYKPRVWYDNLSGTNRPTSLFLRYHVRANWNYFLHKIRGQWEDAVRFAREAIIGVLGSLHYGFSTFGAFIKAVYDRVGVGILYWADNLIQAANTLWLKLPEGIREGWYSFHDAFVYWYSEAKIWVVEQFGAALAAASDAWDWVVVTGQALSAWFDNVGTWVLDWAQNAGERVLGVLGAAWTWLVSLYNDPGGTVTALLGPAWGALVSWYEGPLTFYYNLWGSYATMLGDFLADPLGWVYDRVEAEIVRRW